jgi:polyisoprenoid-binding protein YceI
MMKKSPRIRYAILLLLPFSLPALAQGDERRYIIDDANSQVDAQVRFLGLAHKTARFPDIIGTLRFSIGNFEVIDMVADIDARTLTTGDSETKRLRGRQFFDVEHHPTVRFVGEKMQLTGDRTANVTGRITARGVTRPVTLVVGFSMPPFETTGTEALVIIGSTTIDRREFGMTAFPLVVGNKVKVTIRARLVPG